MEATRTESPSLDIVFWFHEAIAQLDRASDCGSEGRKFESSLPHFFGEMRERLNRAVSKTVKPVRVSRVRIPLSPREYLICAAGGFEA
jgi:hypothetical protein